MLERKAVKRNIDRLIDAGYDIEVTRRGCYLAQREFEDSELRMLIDGVLSSKYITARHSGELIEKLCSMSNRYFHSHVRNIYSVNDWCKTDNQELFLNIETIDEAIESGRQVQFDYSKYGIDKKLHVSSTNAVSPYQLILHNQRYYLMSYNEHFKNLTYYRVDHITNMQILPKPLTPIREVRGYEGGINYKRIASSLPYMYTDAIKRIEFIAYKGIIDHIIDWFGADVKILEHSEKQVKVTLEASEKAMEHWAMQYMNYIEITKPESLREKIKLNLQRGQKKYE